MTYSASFPFLCIIPYTGEKEKGRAVSLAVPVLVKAAYIILGMAMAALGLNVNFGVILREGVRPLTGAVFCSIVIMTLAWFIVRSWF